jgi:5'-nucleotidase
VGIELEGLVAANLCKGTRYLDPLTEANKTAKRLKKDLGCHYVVCLSHLGYKYRGDKVSDIVLAENSDNIDLILGGHTHTFMDGPEMIKNISNEMVMIHQVGFAGILLGRIDIQFERNFRHKCTTCSSDIVQ